MSLQRMGRAQPGSRSDEMAHTASRMGPDVNEDHVTPQQRINPQPAENLAQQDWAGTVRHGLASMAPADKGWILAVAVMFLGMTGINYFTEARQSEALSKYFADELKMREMVEANRSQELRRSQETIKELAATIVRQTDRLSRTQREAELIDQAKQ